MNLLFSIIKNRWAALIVGLILIPLGLVNANSTEQVTCGSQVMHEGDICETTRRGSTTERSFEEQKQNDVTGGYILAGIGGVLLLAGVTQFVVRARRRSSAAAESDATGTTATDNAAAPTTTA
ncbi:hypothetical protein [Actinoplanes subglobosus]|uniref:LPXTG cell wall anchor domain-containing protein n=1 Tax=Actinoplanes subglobosus TaxID=1547892 RepID=A0ABV8J7B3_9ACTN